MQITALVIISLSELQTMDPKYTEEWSNNTQELEQVLFGLGGNVKSPYEKQQEQHRNRFGNIITCSRWVMNERTDKEWIESGHASQAAIDKSSGSKLIRDLYRLKGQVE
jgi:hypothetical protein